MASLNIKSVMLDTSFCMRLMDNNDPLHQNALEYFKHFSSEKITMHVSTVAIAEYSVGDDPHNLPLNYLRIEAFDFIDAKCAGSFHKHLIALKGNIQNYDRKLIINDIKIIAQVNAKNIDAIISKDIKSHQKYIKPLSDAGLMQVRFLDLSVPLNVTLGQLF